MNRSMSTPIRSINAAYAVAGQVSAADFPAIAAQGFATVINNRPDGEAVDQPLNRDLELAALAAGLQYVYLPVVGGGMTPDKVAAMREALATASGPVLAFCRSGARSTQLYELAQRGV